MGQNQQSDMSITVMRPRISSDEEFQERIDRADPFICNQEQLQSLINDAPCEYSQGFLAGLYSFREQLSVLTERAF
jgi:hypothetical protein